MGDGTEESPYTREDVLKAIEKNGGKAEGLDLSEKFFEKKIDLTAVHLEEANLRDAHLEEAELWFAHLEGVYLRDAHLEGAKLWDAHLEEANLGSAHLEGANLRQAHLEGAESVETHFEGAYLMETHLEGAYLVDTHFEGADLSLAHLERTRVRGIRLSPETVLETVIWGNYILGEELDKHYDLASDGYRRLKVWYKNAGYDDTAAKFYYREKEASRKSLKLFSENWNHRIALELSYWVFGHGEGWKRLLFGWIAGVIFVLAAAYYFWGSFSSSSFWDTLYYSATSFSALGYGNWAPQPTGWAKGAGAVEAIIGVFMMALMLVTFIRKWTR